MFLNNPEYVKVGNKKYKINTDFRVAIECVDVAKDESIGNYERALAIIYLLFGDEGLDNPQDHEKLIELGQKYLSLGEEVVDNEEPDMDFKQDMDYIQASFMSDYQIDLTDKKMHWWAFYNLINGLSNSELGNCCVLNRIRNLRTMDLSQIKDNKERQKLQRAKNQVALKKITYTLTEEQERSMEELDKIIGLRKE